MATPRHHPQTTAMKSLATPMQQKSGHRLSTRMQLKPSPNPAAKVCNPNSTQFCAMRPLTSHPGLARLLELRPPCCSREPCTAGICPTKRMSLMGPGPFSLRACKPASRMPQESVSGPSRTQYALRTSLGLKPHSPFSRHYQTHHGTTTQTHRTWSSSQAKDAISTLTSS